MYTRKLTLDPKELQLEINMLKQYVGMEFIDFKTNEKEIIKDFIVLPSHTTGHYLVQFKKGYSHQMTLSKYQKIYYDHYYSIHCLLESEVSHSNYDFKINKFICMNYLYYCLINDGTIAA